MTFSIPQILREHGPLTSGELLAHLERDGITGDAARKRLSRVQRPTRRIVGLKLPKNGRLFYHDEHFNSSRYFEAIEEALKNCGSAHGRALCGLNSQGGAVLAADFPIVAGLSVTNAKKHVRADKVESQLCDLGLLHRVDSPDGTILATRLRDGLVPARRAQRAVEDIFLGVLKTHLGRINLTSYNAAALRMERLPQVGQFAFDFTAPAYASGLFHYGADQRKAPGFVVGDILFGREVTKADLIPFFSKCDALIGQRRIARLLPFFAAESLHEQALAELRARGYLILMPETLYGREFARLLAQLTGVMENVAAALTRDPTAVYAILKKLLTIEGAALNLRAVVLELMAGQWFASTGYPFDIRKRIVTPEGERAEIDVKAEKAREFVGVECKALLPGNLVSPEEVHEWLTVTIPRVNGWLQNRQQPPDRVRYEMWTSTDFHPDAMPLIEQSRQRQRQPVQFLTGAEVLQRLRDERLNTLVDIFKEQFVNTDLRPRFPMRTGQPPLVA